MNESDSASNGSDESCSESVSNSSIDFAVPGHSDFAPAHAHDGIQPPWTKPLTMDDMNYMHKLGGQPISGIILEVKRLHDLAYQLGVEEAKEINRGKYLDIFTKSHQT